MTKEDLKKLRNNLPKGSREVLANRFGFTKSYISNVLTGMRKNDSVLIAAAEIVSDHKRTLQKAKEFIQSLE